ncbi:MAG: hypothetical protein COB00_01215 [Alcanivorax sp.]|nr:MAG: hypothetical protein COB00_01215 [Alcanivorax sp.]
MQISLPLPEENEIDLYSSNPKKSIYSFLNFILAASPYSNLYLFGGIIRDVALLGRKGFNSDIDLVVDGDWNTCANFVEHLGAKKNKFGGYRLFVADWPIDIWNATETWAIKEGLVEYKGIASLTDTTVLNWDAILMNWRTKNFICTENYLDIISKRCLDIILEENPNPLGMAVRVFRHLSMKDARKITPRAIKFLSNTTRTYTYSQIAKKELSSYGNITIEKAIYDFFSFIPFHEKSNFEDKFHAASESIKDKDIHLSFMQKNLFT